MLLYGRNSSARSGSRRHDPVPLRDAPLEARAKFLRRSESFFRQYFDKAKANLAKPHEAAEIGRRTLDLINSIEME